MKRFLILMTVFLLAISVVSAQTWTLSDVTLGSSSQERDENTTATLTITNTGAQNITGITLTSNAASEYGITFSSVSQLNVGQSTSVTVTGQVPLTFDAGKRSIGTITATGTANGAAISGTSSLSMEAENNLEIRDIEIIVNGDDENVDDGDDIKVYPFADVTIIVEIKNTHSDFDIEDIELTVEGEDDLDDIDEDEDFGDLKDGDTDEVEFSFTIDEDADDGTYDVVFTLTGEDEEGAQHGETWTIEFEVEKEGIFITKATLMPETLQCGADSVELRVELSNVDDRDDDEVAFEIESTSLEYEYRISNLEIEEEDEITRTFTIDVPSDARVGNHLIELRAFTDFDDETHSKDIYLAVPSGCDNVAEEEEEEEDSNVIVVTQPKDDTTEDNTQDVTFVDSSEGKSSSTSSSLGNGSVLSTLLLVLANILVLVIIVILVIKFLVRD